MTPINSTDTEGLRELFIKSALKSCEHFNGIQNNVCKAGVTYGDGPMPCFADGRERAAWPCELFHIMSQEEAEVEAEDRVKSVMRTTLARKAAKDDAKIRGLVRGNGGLGAVKCPCCESGSLRYSVASYNGHMHGKCSTLGCVSWME